MKHSFTILLLLATMFATTQLDAQRRTDVIATKGTPPGYELPTEDIMQPKPDDSRGDCCLNFDNYTGYTIYVWVDDTFRGTVAPWDDDYVCVGTGWTTWFARTAGGTYSWKGQGECRGWFNLKLDE